jgi:hypothetical protein
VEMLVHLRDMDIGRMVATGIAVVAWGGLMIQGAALYETTLSVLVALWVMLGYFTILTNLLVAVVFTALAVDRSGLRKDWVVAGTTLLIVMVGVVYGLLLHGTMDLSGGSAVANVITHMVVPTAAVLFWIFLARKGGLSWSDPLRWAVYPLAYVGYGMARGTVTGKFAYPFLNAIALGWTRTMVNACLIAVAFIVSGFAMVWIDRRMGARSV